MTRVPGVLCLLLVLSSSSSPAFAQLTLTEYATGFTRPLGLVQDPIDPSVQYVLEKYGQIWTIRNGVREATPFLDLSAIVWQDESSERGLLGLAFPPDAAASGRAFVFFSSREGGGHSVLARFTRMPGNPYMLDPASRFDLEWAAGRRYIEQPDMNGLHKSGKMVFGPDGYLYLAVGDGGPGFDPENRAQNVRTLHGKILRIDVNVPDTDPVGYRVPETNPFVAAGPPGTRPEIWALGLRNPWRFSIDDPLRGGTGALLISDVGQSEYEEVNYQPAGVGGRNYGWSMREGRHDLEKPENMPPVPQPDILPLSEPFFEYGHGGSFGNSITGGYVYRGLELAPSFRGRYFFADFVFRRLFSIPLNIDPVTREAAPLTVDDAYNHTSELGGQNAVGRVASVDVDARGELYFVDYSGGRVLKLSMDTDGDTLPDGWETQFGLDPAASAGPNGATGDPDADGRTNAQEMADGTHPFNVAALTRFLAEGASNSFFETTVGVANPGAQPASVLLRFLRTDGQVITHPLTVPAKQHATIRPAELAGLQAADFSTVIETNQEVVVERTMAWSTTGRFGSHGERALPAASTSWYLAEGATHGAFDTFYLLENPSGTKADVEIAYLRPGGAAPIVMPYEVEPHRRKTIWVDEELPALAATDVSARITATNGVPIIAERAMYRTSHNTPFMAGHASAGVTAPATHWFFAEGATGEFFELFLLLANPGDTAATVTVRYLLPEGAPIVKTYPVAAQSRETVNVEGEAALLANTAVAMVVESTVPVVAERSMYWPGPPGEGWLEAHNSPGSTETGTAWTVAGGEDGGRWQAQTFVLIANTSAFAGTARVTVLREGAEPLTREFPLAADSRTNVEIGAIPDFAAVRNARFGVLVESVTGAGPTPAQIVVEQATYTSDAAGTFWAAGTNAIATRLQ